MTYFEQEESDADLARREAERERRLRFGVREGEDSEQEKRGSQGDGGTSGPVGESAPEDD